MSSCSGWNQHNLDEVFWFQEGPGVRKWQFTDSGIKLLNVANIEKNRTLNLTKTDRHLDLKEVEERYSHFLLDAGDLVIASSGISFDDDGMLRTRGAFVEEHHLPLCLNTSTIRFKAKTEVSDLGYLQHWLDSREFREQITKRVTGSAQQNFGPSHLKAIKITLPLLSEQRRIAAILDQADALRAKRREALAQLDSLTRSIFVDMFGDPASNPQHWPWTALGSIASKFSDGPFGSNLKSEHYMDVGVRVVRLQNIGVGEFVDNDKVYISERHFESIKKHECRPGDVLVGTMGDPNLRACILPDSIPLAINKADCVQIRVNSNKANSSFICSLLNHPSTELLAQDLKHGQTRVRISMGSLRSLNVPIPPLHLQNEFAIRLNEVKKLKTSHFNSLAELDALFASLQHRAFQGVL